MSITRHRAGQVLREYCRTHNVSLQELAEKAGCSRSLMFKVSCGDRRMSMKMAVRIQQATGGTLDAVLMLRAQQDTWEEPTWEDYIREDRNNG